MEPTTPGAKFSQEELDKPVTFGQLKNILDIFSEQQEKFDVLCGHLGLNVSRVHRKFEVLNFNVNRTAMDCMPSVEMALKKLSATKKWYQFWK